MHDFTDFRSAKFQEICTHDVDLRGAESFQNEFLKTFSQGVIFSNFKLGGNFHREVRIT